MVKTTVFTILIEHGANLEVTNDNGWTALHFAAYYGQTKIVKILIEIEANLEATTKNKKQRFTLPLQKDTPKLLKPLLRLGLI